MAAAFVTCSAGIGCMAPGATAKPADNEDQLGEKDEADAKPDRQIAAGSGAQLA